MKHFRPIRLLILAFFGLSGFSLAWGFSLLGPFTSWMDENKGYRFDADIGGPMNLGEEYRWNLPVLTYGFDLSFIDYFGSNGVVEVEKAIQMLNALPPASAMNLNDFSVGTSRFNFRAQALDLLDLRSFALKALLEQMGLAAPERYVWTLRQVDIGTVNGLTTTNYFVIQRNFDPQTWLPSAEINGTLYTYQIRSFPASSIPAWHAAVPMLADPLSAHHPAVAGTFPVAGLFYTNLTRDDAGGLRYLLSSQNRNVERLVAGVTAEGTSPQELVTTALRPGVEKITFVRVPFDSLIEMTPPFTNVFTDTYISNGIPIQQALKRVVTRPDILFSAADLGSYGVYSPVLLQGSRTDRWMNHADLNSQTATEGPGVIPPGAVITFAKLGPAYFNRTPWFLDEGNAFSFPSWATFDGTTNAPIVYPGGLQLPLNPTIQLRLADSPQGPALQWRRWGLVGERYRLEYSDDLLTWTEVTLTHNATGIMEFSFPVDPNQPQRFYRLIPE